MLESSFHGLIMEFKERLRMPNELIVTVVDKHSAAFAEADRQHISPPHGVHADAFSPMLSL
jgi:hypothetical protein